MPKVSVIIPVYNSEKYLSECLDSVVNQTLKDIEIICVNDGSKDSSLRILEEYASKDNRVKIINQENKGAGLARNSGLEIAQGEYLSLLDSDDIFEHDMLEILYKKAKEKDTDILICRSKEFYEKTKKYKDLDYSIREEYLPKKDVFNCNDIPKYIMNFAVGWAWDKLYKSDFVKNYGLNFPNLHNTEDAVFVFPSLIYAEKISIIQNSFITHRKTSTSLENSRDKNYLCFIEASRMIKRDLEDRNLYKKVEQSFINWFVDHSFWQIDTLKNKSNRKNLAKILDNIFEEFEIYEKNFDYFYDNKLYERVKKKKFIKSEKLYQKIFSIKNSSDKMHKIIIIFGIKIAFKRRCNA